MIPLARVRSTGAIVPTFRGARLVNRSRDLLDERRELRRGAIEKHDWDSDVWKRAKEQLLRESSDKCAYCEAPTAVVSYGDVEHYRPKSVYWWLAYCLDNYLVSCQICNQRFKSDRFPLAGPRWRGPRVASNSSDARLDLLADALVPDPLDATAVTRYAADHAAEWPLLVNPYLEDPADYFAWRADLVIKEVELVAIPGDDDSAACVDAAKDVYGLNRKQLMSLRYFIFQSYYTHRLTLADAGISAATRAATRQVVADMAGDDRPFAGMIRFFEGLGDPDAWETAGYLVR